MQLNRDSLVSGVPASFEGEIVSMSPLDSTGSVWIVNIDYCGVDIVVPLSKEAVANLLLKKGLVTAPPGEVIPVPKARTRGGPKMGPKVGTIKTVNGKKKVLARYDFTTPRLKGKRRVCDPDTKRKGFPVWELL